MIETAKLKEAITFCAEDLDDEDCDGISNHHLRAVVSAARLVLAAQSAESAVEAVARALFDNGPLPHRPSVKWDSLSQDWKDAFRKTASVALTAASLSETVTHGVTEEFLKHARELVEIEDVSQKYGACEDYKPRRAAAIAGLRAALSSRPSTSQVRNEMKSPIELTRIIRELREQSQTNQLADEAADALERMEARINELLDEIDELNELKRA